MVQENIPPCVYQISFSSSDDKSLILVKSILLATGFSVADIIEHDDLKQKSIRIFVSNWDKVKGLRQLFRNLKLAHVLMRSVTLKSEDWLLRWKKDWRPSKLTHLLDVVPMWCHAHYKFTKERDYILLDTILSFGSGLHETTQIVSQMIEDKRHSIKTFLDIGTGTGILSIVALKHGAKNVVALDISELSVKAACDNLKVNHFKAKVSLADINQYKISKTYDFVAANLVTQDLIKSQQRITSCVKPGGYLAVSGISLSNCAIFEKGFDKTNFLKVETIKAKEWAGYLYQKKM